MPGYVVNGTQQSTTMEDYAVRYSMYLNGFNGFMLNLIFHDSSIFSPTKKTLQSSEQHLFKHLPWFPTEISIYSIYIYTLWCTQVQTEDQTSGSPSTSQGPLNRGLPRSGPPRSKIPRGRGHTSLTWGTAKSMIKLPGGIIASKKKHQQTREEPHGTKTKKTYPPDSTSTTQLFVKVNYRSYTWHGDVTWMKLGCMKLGWILK